MKPTKAGVKAALLSLGYTNEQFPNILQAVTESKDFTHEDMSFARYLIYDTDFGGAWNDDSQIAMHCD